MAIKPGYYKIWVEYGTDGVTYPNEYTDIIMVCMSDNITRGQLVSNGIITGEADEILVGRDIIKSYFSNGKLAMNFGSNPSSAYQDSISGTINNFGRLGMSLSRPTEFTLVRTYYKIYLDAAKTIFAGEGYVHNSGSSGNGIRWLNRRACSGIDSYQAQYTFIQLNTSLTFARFFYIRGNAKDIYLDNIGSMDSNYIDLVTSILNGVEPILGTDDPNDQGGTSGGGGGTGNFDNSSESASLTSMPSISAADAGLITLFRPSLSELKALGQYLWTHLTDIWENIQKMFANPMDYIIALNILPVLPNVGTSRNIRLGLWESDISMPPVLSQWYEFDCGSITVSEYWGSALDYSPNTKVHAMLPFIGSVQLSTDEIMGKTLHLIYRIDLLSGHCVAVITVNDDVYYQFTGNCAVSVPLTGADWSRVYGAIVGAIATGATLGAGAAGAGAGVAAASQLAHVAETEAVQADLALMTGNAGAMTSTQHMALQARAAQAGARYQAAKSAQSAAVTYAAGNVVSQIMGSKISVSHTGSISGSAGFLGMRQAYILIEYPNQSLAENHKHFFGYPSNMYSVLSGLSGFTQCQQVIFESTAATDDETSEIINLLKEGVYL